MKTPVTKMNPIPSFNTHSTFPGAGRTSAWAAVFLTLFTLTTHAQSKAENLIEAVKQTYLRVHDYEVDLTVTLDIARLRVPDMRLHMYYKQPGKVHFEAERKNSFAMLPRQGLVFNPVELFESGYDVVVQGQDTIGSTPCTKLVLLARSDTLRLQRVVLFIDPRLNVVRRMQMTPYQGKMAEVTFDYTLVDHRYPLPSRAVFRFDASRGRRSEAGRPNVKRFSTLTSGSVTIVYSKYRVNKGIPDSIFKKE